MKEKFSRNLSFRTLCSPHSHRGFTLLEIIIVLIIIGIVSGLVGLTISRGSANRQLNIFTKDVSSILRYARNRAVSEKKIYCFVIDTGDQAFRLYSEDTDYKNVKTVIDRPIPEGLIMSLQGSDEDSPHIEFLPRGNSTGGTLEIMHEGGKVFLLNINRITGKVEMVEPE